jgi:short-subunit dehydrogenase involved in D-alanine esterification of teichoic acids
MKPQSRLPWPLRFQRNTRVVQLFADGKSLREMAHAVGLSHPAVLVILNEVGLSCSTRNEGRAKDVTKVTARLDENFQRVMATLGQEGCER